MKCDASAFQKWGIKRIIIIVAIIVSESSGGFEFI